MNIRKTSRRRALLLAAIAGAAVFQVLILLVVFKSPTQSAATLPPKNDTVLWQTAPIQQEPVRSGLPVLLKIPAINVDTPIKPVGITRAGDMEAPPDGASYVGWYKSGPHPGDTGSAVIAGHYGWTNKVPAIFNNLHKLQKGDKLYIQDDAGVTIAFVVRESRRYDPEADTSGIFRPNDGKSHLNLITCEGAWDESRQTYSDRLVVFTDRE